MPLETRQVAHERILVDTAATLSATRLDYTGESAAASGAVTVSVARADGSAVITGATPSHAGAGLYRVTLTPAQNDRLDVLTATWTEASGSTWQTKHEVVGGVWFTVAAAREVDEKLSDGVKYPAARIMAKRSEVEYLLEHETGQAWVPRYARLRVAGSGNRWLPLNLPFLRSVRSVFEGTYEGDEVAFTANDLEYLVAQSASGVLERRDGFAWSRNYTYTVEVEYGHDAPPPDLRDAAITLLRHRLNSTRSGIPDRATSMSTEQGQTFSLATPGLRGFVTGIPDVDVTIARHKFSHYGMA